MEVSYPSRDYFDSGNEPGWVAASTLHWGMGMPKVHIPFFMSQLELLPGEQRPGTAGLYMTSIC